MYLHPFLYYEFLRQTLSLGMFPKGIDLAPVKWAQLSDYGIKSVETFFCLILFLPGTEERKSSRLSKPHLRLAGTECLCSQAASQLMSLSFHRYSRKREGRQWGQPYHSRMQALKRDHSQRLSELLIISMRQLKSRLLKWCSSEVREERVKAECMSSHYFLHSKWEPTVCP